MTPAQRVDRSAGTEPGRGTAWGLVAWVVWGLVGVGVVVVVLLDARLRQIGRPDLVSISGDAYPYLLAMVSAATTSRCRG